MQRYWQDWRQGSIARKLFGLLLVILGLADAAYIAYGLGFTIYYFYIAQGADVQLAGIGGIIFLIIGGVPGTLIIFLLTRLYKRKMTVQ